MRRDPFVLRQYSPVMTIGGGILLDTNAKPHRRFDAAMLSSLARMTELDPQEVLLSALTAEKSTALSAAALARVTGLAQKDLEDMLDKMVLEKRVLKTGRGTQQGFFLTDHVVLLGRRLQDLLQHFHEKNPLKPGMSKAELRTGMRVPEQLFDLTLQESLQTGRIAESAGWIRLPGHAIHLSPADGQIAAQVREIMLKSGYSTPSLDEMARTGVPLIDLQRVIGALQGRGEVVRLEGDIYYLREQIDSARQVLLEFAQKNTELSVSRFRELLNTSRKYALALLGYFDQIGLTQRVGDGRMVNSDPRGVEPAQKDNH